MRLSFINSLTFLLFFFSFTLGMRGVKLGEKNGEDFFGFICHLEARDKVDGIMT